MKKDYTSDDLVREMDSFCKWLGVAIGILFVLLVVSQCAHAAGY